MVALLSEKADVQYFPEETDPEVIVKTIKDLGFGASVIPEQEDGQQGKLDVTVSGGWNIPFLIDPFTNTFGKNLAGAMNGVEA